MIERTSLVVSDSLQPHGLQPFVSCVHGILQARILGWVAFPSPGDLPNPWIKPRSPILQADSLPSEPPAKPSDPKPLQIFCLFYQYMLAKGRKTGIQVGNLSYLCLTGFLGSSDGKESTCSAGDLGFNPWVEKFSWKMV